MKRDTLLRLFAATPLAGPLAMLGTKAAPVVENVNVGGAVPMAIREIPEAERLVQVYAEGFHPGTGVMIYEAVGEIPQGAFAAGAQDVAATARALPDLEAVLAKNPGLDRLTAQFYENSYTTFVKWHAPIDPATLPLGWVKDFTAVIREGAQ